MESNTDFKFKMAIILRTDLGMDKGKMVAQGAHAAVDVALWGDKRDVMDWKCEGQRKIVLKVKTEQELKDIANKVLDDSIYVGVIRDFGLTQIPAGSLTAIAFVGRNEIIDPYIKDLKLL